MANCAAPIVDMSEFQCTICHSSQLHEACVAPPGPVRDDSRTTETAPPGRMAHSAITAEQWAQARKCMDLVGALARKGRYRRTIADVDAVAKALGRSAKTIYRWLNRFEKAGTIEVFLTKERSDQGRSRLRNEVEEVMQQAIRDLLLAREYGTVKAAYSAVRKHCVEAGYPAPSIGTVRNRYLQLSGNSAVTNRPAEAKRPIGAGMRHKQAA